jgi:hypothetical protein
MMNNKKIDMSNYNKKLRNINKILKNYKYNYFKKIY